MSNSFSETFKTNRVTNYQSEINLVLSAYHYVAAITADYNSSGLFTIENVGIDLVTIEHPNSGFFNESWVTNTTGGAVSVDEIVNTPDEVFINILGFSFSEASNSCQDVQLNITTDVLAVKYRINGGADISNANNPFSFEQLRGAYINLEVEDVGGQTSDENIQIPKTLSASNTVINIINSPSGATVTAVVSDADGLILTYSLDNITYQSSNTFIGILEGDHTFYIKDQLGCNIQKDFTVLSFESGNVNYPYADLPSKSNSIRFAKRVLHENCSNYKNDENTLSSEQAYTVNSRIVNQLFQECDNITTQIKTNYENINVTVIKEDLTETNIPVNKKSNNIGLKNKRDATKYSLGNNQTGIFFTSGNTYDYYTDVINGTYALNGGLPIWGTIGNYMFISGVWYQITDIIYDEQKNSEVLVINDNYTGVDVSVIVGAVYNLQEYEVYEFTINMGDYSNQKIQINITETDSIFDEVIFLSEIIEIKERHPKTVEIKYFNDTNTDIFYSTGIENKIRIPIEYVEGGVEDETDSEKTDVNVYLINAEVYENDTFHFNLLSKQLMRKVVQALSHKFVTIDEVSYVKESSPSITPLIGTNLYRLSAIMAKSENVYTNKGTGTELEIGTIEVPKLLEQTSGGFIKWTI